MDGMALITTWKRINLVCGLSEFLIKTEYQQSLTNQGSNFVSSLVMEFGLIGYLLGLNMRLWTLPDLQHHMTAFIGTPHPRKGDNVAYIHAFPRDQKIILS